MTGPLQIVLGTISVLFLIVASVMAYRAVRAMVRIIRTGQPDGTRFGPVKTRLKTHGRSSRWATPGCSSGRPSASPTGSSSSASTACSSPWSRPSARSGTRRSTCRSSASSSCGTCSPTSSAPARSSGSSYLIYRRQKDHPRRQGRKSRFAGSNEGRGYFVEAVVLTVGICILLIRALKISSDLTDAPAWSHPVSGALATVLPDSPDLLSVVAFVKIVVSPDLAGGHQPDPEHGRRLAPVQRLLQHLLQARGRRRRRPRPAAADDQRRQADRLRGSGRGRRLRPRQDRGLHLEGDAGLHHLHRVRAVPEPVPGVEHGQAAQPEDGDHGPARPPLRQGPVPARRADRVARPRPTTTSSGPATSRPGPPATPASRAPTTPRRTARWSAPSRRAGSSTPTSCGAAPTAAPASSSARSTSSTSTTSWTCAATRC